MKSPTSLPLLVRSTFAGVAALASVALAADIDWKPFTVDHRQRETAPSDVSFLLEGPAGRDGFITMKGGHLVKADGSRFRIWGVNMTGWTRGSNIMPPKDDAARWAQVLARAGVNCVRFHFLDLTSRPADDTGARGGRGGTRPAGIVDGSQNDSRHFTADSLDRLDYFIAELKKVGIYSNLNLNVGRTYRPGDAVPDSGLITQAKGMTYIGEELIKLQREYAQMLLTHRNPYTNSEYRNEPAVATVEIVNENSVYEFWFRNWLRGELVPNGPRLQLDFTPHYAKQLDEMYQAWLAKNRTPAQLAQIRKVAGVAANDAVPRIRRSNFSVAPKEQFHAEADFYAHVEKTFLVGMYDYLKKEIGVKSLVIGNADHTYWIPNQPMMRANGLLDFIDGHVYWQHPAIWGRRNEPMVNSPLTSTIVKLARSPHLDRPFTVSEVNHPNPAEYGAEMIPILASYAAFQDWDGIYFYTFETKSGNAWQNYVADNFDITLDPVKMIQMRVGALLFSRGDVKPAKETFARSYSTEQVNEAMRLPESERPYFTPGFPRSMALRHGNRIRSIEGKPTDKYPAEVAPPYISDTGELQWHLVSEERGGLLTIDTPNSQGLVGFVRANAKLTTKHLLAEVKNEFCAITLSSLTKEPIQRSKKLLLTAAARWQNTGSKWNERRTLWEEWGAGPTLIEPVTGWLVLRELDGALAVRLTPLDGASQPIGQPINGRRLEDGWEIPLGTGTAGTTHYLIEITN